MKNRRNIVEQQNPPQNPNDIWLKDGKFYRSTSEGWTVIDSELEYTNKETMIADNPKGGTIGIDKESGAPSIYNDVTKQWSPLGGGVTETTWQELKNKRDASKLTPGALYRITDYNCTTTQENTQSAGHQFDIVLLALSENKLAEEGWAMMHDNIYDVTFADGVTKKCWVYRDDYNDNIVDCESLLGIKGFGNDEVEIDETTKTVTTSVYVSTELVDENLTYNYFQNSNLSAWKVWYCLDNDKSRFAWADDSVDKDSPASIEVNGGKVFERSEVDDASKGEFRYAWKLGGIVLYTQNTTPSQGDSVYFDPSGIGKTDEIEAYNPPQEGTGLPNGRGVIYRLIDEYNNDIKYDFKNILFVRKLTDGQYDADNGTNTWCYTLNLWHQDMCQDASIVGNTLPNDEGYINGVYDNIFGYATAYDFYIGGVDTFAFALEDNVVLSFDNDGYCGIYSNTIGNSFYSNTIGNYFNSNTIGNNFHHNKIGNNFYSNIIGNDFSNRTISDDTSDKNYGNMGVELATKNDIGNIETALSNI